MKSTHANFNRNVHCLLGLPFDAISLVDATEHIRQAAFNRTPCFLSTPNLNFLITAQSNKPFRESVIRSDLSLADGMPIVWMSKFCGIPIRERVAGSDVFEALRRSTGRKIKVYFFGGPEGVAERAMQVLNAEDGGLECVGYESPGFGSIAEMSTPDRIEKINNSGAEFLVVSLGAVKGQAWIEHNLDALNVPVVSHLGAVVNFVAGNVSRAPRWMQKTGLEWLWRIVEEPTLWRRYWSDGLALLQFGLRQILTNSRCRAFVSNAEKNREPFSVQYSLDTTQLNISISGSCKSQYLEGLRDILVAQVNQMVDINIDAQEATSVDSAYMGVLALVCGQQLNRNKGLVVISRYLKKYSFNVVNESV